MWQSDTEASPRSRKYRKSSAIKEAFERLWRFMFIPPLFKPLETVGCQPHYIEHPCRPRQARCRADPPPPPWTSVNCQLVSTVKQQIDPRRVWGRWPASACSGEARLHLFPPGHQTWLAIDRCQPSPSQTRPLYTNSHHPVSIQNVCQDTRHCKLGDLPYLPKVGPSLLTARFPVP